MKPATSLAQLSFVCSVLLATKINLAQDWPQCRDAATGNQIWQKDENANSWPMFYTSSSPIIVDGLCIAQLGGSQDGGIIAYDLATGQEKWRWMKSGPAYASPVLMTVDGVKAI